MHAQSLGQKILDQKGSDYEPIHESDESGKESFHDTLGRIGFIAWVLSLYKEKKAMIRCGYI